MTDRAEINRANAQFSTGPLTEAGKQKSSLNALRHGLTGRTVVMPAEDREAYQLHLKSFTGEYHPVDATEVNLVQALADVSWRLNRIATLETILLTHGEVTGASLASALEIQTKALANLSMHSQRLSRQFERTVTQLRSLQKTRRTLEQCEMDRVVDIIQMHKSKGQTYDPSTHGFVFSPAQIQEGIRGRNRECLASKARNYRSESVAA